MNKIASILIMLTKSIVIFSFNKKLCEPTPMIDPRCIYSSLESDL